MAKFNLCRRLFTIQLICMTISILLVDVEGGFFSGVVQKCKTMTRSIASIPSKLADGGQFATQKVVGALGNAVRPVRPLKRVVDATGGAISNVMGSASRLLGKTVEPPNKIIFLYSRPLKHLGTSRLYQEAIRTVIAHALTNVVLHKDEMDEAADTPANLGTMPVLKSVVEQLERAGASDDDIADIVSVLGRNGKQDLPVQIKSKVLGILKDTNGNFKSDGPMNELRWIAEHPHGFYQMDDKERTDYKLKTQKKYTSCTVLHPPSFDITNT
ncbi:uncharacterized protein LOC100574813 [Acyrthosiphon pisum]|uniref:Uncharacterized protein n=1 Tax=Acyrthosiphon pisum TaxID=7029 RepID=A0A8R1W4F2_ACYPI|nr:uncharacterized protein LOC100574813 [Acyrthosiphon pisum]|eukprot:XP_003242289.1 PREDICTED: uncharacterized protein LOC100574813 [Acyrthosiphon pisum]